MIPATAPSPAARQLIAISVICLSLTLGAWMILVAPARGQQADLELERARLTAEITEQGNIGGDVARWTSRLRQSVEATRRLAAVSAVASSDRAVLERLGGLAEGAGLRIDEMRPQDIALTETLPAALPQAGGPPLPGQASLRTQPSPQARQSGDVRRAVRLVMSGTFDSVARFFEALDTPDQLATVRSFRIVADGRPGPPAVVTEISLELFAPLAGDPGQSAALAGAAPQSAPAGALVSGADK